MRVIEWWVEVGRECFNIGNFNSLMGIIAGLNMSTVSRLKKTVSCADVLFCGGKEGLVVLVVTMCADIMRCVVLYTGGSGGIEGQVALVMVVAVCFYWLQVVRWKE